MAGSSLRTPLFQTCQTFSIRGVLRVFRQRSFPQLSRLLQLPSVDGDPGQEIALVRGGWLLAIRRQQALRFRVVSRARQFSRASVSNPVEALV